MPKVKLGIPSPKQQRETFNRIIAIAMAYAGVRTQAALGVMLGMSRATLSKRMNHGGWSYEEVCRLVRVLKLSADDAAALLGVKAA